MPSGSFDAIDLFLLVIGGFLLLKKVAELEGHHRLRVAILTVVFSVPVILFFLGYGLTLGNPHHFECVITFSEPSD